MSLNEFTCNHYSNIENALQSGTHPLYEYSYPNHSSTYVLTFYFRLLDNLPQRKTAFINIMSLGAEEYHESVMKGSAKIRIS